MRKFKVSVCRTSFRHTTIEVESNSIEEAKEKALDKAYNMVFPNETSAEYEITGTVCIAPYRKE